MQEIPIYEPEITANAHVDSEENKSGEKKPIKTTRKQRVTSLIKKINEDSLEMVIQDILTENKRIRRELENMRVQNTSLKREYEELMHNILKDRLTNQSSQYQLN